jgi:sugar O-acyltransferase (sialic acid O-acetyltransferase NeuD family)
MATAPHPLQRERPGEEVVIVGAGEQGEIADAYLTHDSPHTVVGFAVERHFLENDSFLDRPLVALDELPERFPPARCSALVAVSSTQLNRVRGRLVEAVRAQGFACVSYVSTQALVWPEVEIGDNCFVFEGCMIQRGACLEDNVIAWSGAHVAHRTVVEADCFLAAQAAVAGFCRIGRGSFLGVNCSIADGVSIGAASVVGAGAVVISDTAPGSVNVGNPARATGADSASALDRHSRRPR